uniref:Thioredoxin domain-containing protein n=1 Tax=Lotharella globosa TaxID=91324 RepID=A0A7S4DIX7_9EUKA
MASCKPFYALAVFAAATLCIIAVSRSSNQLKSSVASHSIARFAKPAPFTSRNLRRKCTAPSPRAGHAMVVGAGAGGLITEVDKDSYYPTLKNAGGKLILVDFYTDWCGPCKMIYPYLEELARENPDTLQIVKLNCAGENRELVNELGVRVLPTFLFYKNEENIATVKVNNTFRMSCMSRE